MNQQALEMAVFALSKDFPELTPAKLQVALEGLKSQPEEIWLTKKEAAAMLGIACRTLSMRRHDFKLRWVRRSYRDVRVAKSSIVEYLERCEEKNPFDRTA